MLEKYEKMNTYFLNIMTCVGVGAVIAILGACILHSAIIMFVGIIIILLSSIAELIALFVFLTM